MLEIEPKWIPVEPIQFRFCVSHLLEHPAGHMSREPIATYSIRQQHQQKPTGQSISKKYVFVLFSYITSPLWWYLSLSFRFPYQSVNLSYRFCVEDLFILFGLLGKSLTVLAQIHRRERKYMKHRLYVNRKHQKCLFLDCLMFTVFTVYRLQCTVSQMDLCTQGELYQWCAKRQQQTIGFFQFNNVSIQFQTKRSYPSRQCYKLLLLFDSTFDEHYWNVSNIHCSFFEWIPFIASESFDFTIIV